MVPALLSEARVDFPLLEGEIWWGRVQALPPSGPSPLALGFKVKHSARSMAPLPALRERGLEKRMVGDPPLNSGYTNSHLHLQTSSCESTVCRCEGLFAQAGELSTHRSQERLFLHLGHIENPPARSPAFRAAHDMPTPVLSLLPQPGGNNLDASTNSHSHLRQRLHHTLTRDIAPLQLPWPRASGGEWGGERTGQARGGQKRTSNQGGALAMLLGACNQH